MPAKLEFQDYDPLKNRRSNGASEEAEAWPFRRKQESTAGLNAEGASSERGITANGAASSRREQVGFSTLSNKAKAGVAISELDTRQKGLDVRARDDGGRGYKDQWILKRGHAISFAGLFLFTVVLYFRPYELSRSLEWMSSIAFWIAVFTLIVFIPTQLGLEGRLTITPREVWLVLLLVLTALLSVPFALDVSMAWGGFTQFLKVVVMFIVMVNVVRSEGRLRALFLVALAVSCFLSVGAVADFRIGNFDNENLRISGIVGGIFSNPNDLALHLVTMVPIAIGLLVSSRNPLKKVIYLICGITLVLGIIVTLSRSGFIAFVCSIFFLIWKLAPRGRIIFAALGLLLIVTIVGVAPSAFRSRIATTKDESAIARFDDLKRSVYLMVRHPLLGVGMGNYILYSNSAKATHNAYTQVGAEMGIAAAVIYLLFVIAPLKPLRRIELENVNVKKKPRFYYLAIALQASLIGYMVASFFASVAYLWYVYYLVAYALCLRRIYETANAKVQTAAS